MIRAIYLPQFESAIDALLADVGAQYGISAATADYGGFRTEGDTAQAQRYRQDDYAVYAAGERGHGRTPVPIDGPWENGNNRPIAPFGSSYHNFASARDLTISDAGDFDSADEALAYLGSVAPQYGLRWGGTFAKPRTDVRHFELAVPLTTARDLFTTWSGGRSSDDVAAAAGPSGATTVGMIAAIAGGLWLLRTLAHHFHGAR